MLNTTLPFLRCPKKRKGKDRCAGKLKLASNHPPQQRTEVYEVRSGNLTCKDCGSRYPIISGIVLLVENVSEYLVSHVKGISRLVPLPEIPLEYRDDFLTAKAEIEIEQVEEDLEAQRVMALYLMNHYLSAGDESGERWWKPRSGEASPLIDSLIREYWDKSPIVQIGQWVSRLAKQGESMSTVVELGCGVGGIYPVIRPYIKSYLGVDSSFSSIALARHVALGMPYSGSIAIPEDLLQGHSARKLKLRVAKGFDGSGDFIVGDIDAPPLASESWDLCLVLNAIDMLEEPASLPRLQHKLLKAGGIAIQTGPYIWHEFVSKRLRPLVPAELRGDSARAVEWLYEQAGFTIEDRINHLPWLFFKHVRQLEIYSVHLLLARKRA
ncbi:MAG: methyltransferase domain-containing protein [Oligoflexia bacterium]|nr:methyltransferase domain-containing protein [Oligoflexia bacterium]